MEVGNRTDHESAQVPRIHAIHIENAFLGMLLFSLGNKECPYVDPSMYKGAYAKYLTLSDSSSNA